MTQGKDRLSLAHESTVSQLMSFALSGTKYSVVGEPRWCGAVHYTLSPPVAGSIELASPAVYPGVVATRIAVGSDHSDA